MRMFAPALLCALSLGAGPQALAGNPLVDQMQAICMANHADPTKVLAIADLAGWSHPANRGPGTIVVTPYWRIKPLDGSTPLRHDRSDLVPNFLMLRVREGFEMSEFGNLRVLTCTMTGPPSMADTTSATEKLLGRPPQERSDPLTSVWTYQDTPPAGRRFLDDKTQVREALSVAPVAVLVVREAGGGADTVSMIYREQSITEAK